MLKDILVVVKRVREINIEMPGEVWLGEVRHHFCVFRHVFCYCS